MGLEYYAFKNPESFYGRQDTTTWLGDFLTAEDFGADAVKDTFDRGFYNWKDDPEMLGWMAVTLNHRLWTHFEEGNEELAKLYDELWRKADKYAKTHFEGDDFTVYFEITD